MKQVEDLKNELRTTISAKDAEIETKEAEISLQRTGNQGQQEGDRRKGNYPQHGFCDLRQQERTCRTKA
jgi:hypothetical protein